MRDPDVAMISVFGFVIVSVILIFVLCFIRRKYRSKQSEIFPKSKVSNLSINYQTFLDISF